MPMPKYMPSCTISKRRPARSVGNPLFLAGEHPCALSRVMRLQRAVSSRLHSSGRWDRKRAIRAVSRAQLAPPSASGRSRRTLAHGFFWGLTVIKLGETDGMSCRRPLATRCRRSEHSQLRTSTSGEVTSSTVDLPRAAFGIKRRRAVSLR